MANIKVPPHDEIAEESVLGAILIDKDAIGIACDIISPNDFYNETNKIVYQAMLALYEKGKPIDVVTLAEEFKKNKAGKIGSSYLTDLVNQVPSAGNIEHYSLYVKELSTKRKLIKAGSSLVEMGFLDEEAKMLLDRAQSEIFSITESNTRGGFTHIKDALAESFDRIDEIHKRGEGLRGIRTGFTDLDNKLSGLQSSNLVILAARPGQGKTAMAVNIAQSVSVAGKSPVAIFSLEMSKEELVDRLLVGQADVDAWRLKTGKLSESDFAKLSQAMGELADAPIFIDDSPGLSIFEIRTRARRLQLEHKTALIIIDYLQLVDPGRRYDNRVQEVSVVSQALKNLARELKVPVLALSQLSRAVEHRGEKKPQLADLRESGSIEQDADVVMFLYRTDDVLTTNMNIKLLISKHRNGPTGEIDLLFRGDRIKFYSTEKRQLE
ncbi:MAG: replicative DNA helicase [Patescibacteria group bacterium]|nr:replicative DNA helicase [Patescibacteria group bacterium]